MLQKNIVTVCCCFFSLICMAQTKSNWPVELNKTFTKTYNVGTKTLVLQNKFGTMEIEAWDKNECKIDVVIYVGARDKEKAEKILDGISIENKEKDELIEIKTEIDNNNSWGGNINGDSREIKINYKAFVPKKSNVVAENSFGPLTISDFSGIAILSCKYGTITTGKLLGSTKITTEYGKAIINEIANLNLIGKYSTIDIKKVLNNFDASFSYCQNVEVAFNNTIKDIAIKSNYSSLYLGLDQNISANYSIKCTNSRFINSSLYAFDEIKPTTNTYYNPTKKYEGNFGDKIATQIKITSNYGSLKILK